MASASALLMGLVVTMTVASLLTNVVHGCSVKILNNCPFAVTTCAESAEDPISQYQLGSGASQLLDFGSSCKWTAGAIWRSITGQCANPPGTNVATDKNLANLAEFTIGPGSGTDFYDLSNINAYNIGLGISIISAVAGDDTYYSCKPNITCSISDISSFCQPNNVLKTEPSGAVSCINTDGTNGLGPTSGTEQFKAACPDALAYSFDSAASTFTCGTGSNYQVTFCP